MSVEVPAEPVYYYECSSGAFRLIYFIPPKELQRLKQEKGLSKQALHEFPDGLDLPCTEADFADFDQRYGYRPPTDPEALRSAFFALWSDTKNWQKSIHAGFVPAEVVEQNVSAAEQILHSKPAPPEILPKDLAAPAAARPSLKDRRTHLKKRVTRQKSVETALKRMKAKGVDRAQTLEAQTFGAIKMEKGEKVQELFIRLNQDRKGP